MKGDLHEEVSSLLDGKIEAAAGTVVGAKDQHHILVADGAAQGLLVTHQRHGMDGLQTLHQTLRVILALIQQDDSVFPVCVPHDEADVPVILSLQDAVQ